jgi:hypothetical protein
MDIKSPILQRIHKKLLYNKKMSPDKNVNRFYEATRTLHYEWIEIEIGKIKQHYLISAWENFVVLRDITMNFRSTFETELVAKSMDGTTEPEFRALLAKCQLAVRHARHYFNISYTDILTISKPAHLDESFPVNPLSLPDKHKLEILKCYNLIVVLFNELFVCIEEEIKEFERREYVRTTSTYNWSGDKNELSELGMALFASGKISRRDGKKIMPSTLARELAAFFSIDSLDYDQNVMAMTWRTNGSKTEFLDDLKKKAEEYFTQRIEDQC